MKKKVVMVIVVLAVCIGYTFSLNAQDFKEQKNRNLSEFCGLKNDIRGHFGIQVDKSFFYKRHNFLFNIR